MAENNRDEISINLNCYLIRFRKRNNKEVYYKVNEAFLGKAFTKIVNGFVKFLDTSAHKTLNGDRIIYLQDSLTVKKTYYSGIIKKGYSGQETTIDELDANKAKTVGTIRTNQYNSSPFYFLLAQPDTNSKYVIFLSQSYKQFGFKEMFEDAFKEFYKSKVTEEFVCEFSTLSIASLFDKYINEGDIRKVRFRKHGLNQNIENLLSNRENGEDFDVELSIKARKNGFMGIKDNISAKESSFIETIKIENFDYDQVFADISYGGRKRVLNITRPEDFSASFDLTDKCDINAATKHPDFEKLDKEAISLLKEEIIPNIDQ